MPGEFGTETVRANIEPEAGAYLAGQVTANGDNQWRNLLPVGVTSLAIESLSVKALGGNAGMVYTQGPGGPAAGWELDAGESNNIPVDDLADVSVYIPTSGDGVCWQVVQHNGV